MSTVVLRTTTKPSIKQGIQRSIQRGVFSTALVLASMLTPSLVLADITDDIVNKGVNRTKSGAASQKRIDAIADKTEKIVSKYQQQAKIVEGLKIFNDRLRRTLEAQEVAMRDLEQSIEDASLIERQIVPLMTRMIEGLDQFIAVDMPFQVAERKARVERIRGYLTNANISAAERFRQVLEAYTTENNYGKSINVYTDTLSLDGGNLTVYILQVGRAGLYYQTLDGTVSGYWNKAERAWQKLDSSYNEGITTSIRIAQGKESKDLMRLPISAPEAI